MYIQSRQHLSNTRTAMQSPAHLHSNHHFQHKFDHLQRNIHQIEMEIATALPLMLWARALQNSSFWIQNSSFLIHNSSFLIQNSSFLLLTSCPREGKTKPYEQQFLLQPILDLADIRSSVNDRRETGPFLARLLTQLCVPRSSVKNRAKIELK